MGKTCLQFKKCVCDIKSKLYKTSALENSHKTK
jgi:hypothetical protein